MELPTTFTKPSTRQPRCFASLPCERGALSARAQRARAPARAYRGQRVGGFAALGNDDYHVAVIQHRVAVDELARVLHLHHGACVLLNEVLADKARVPRRSARANDDALGRGDAIHHVPEAAQHHGARGRVDAPADAVLQGARLVQDFFDHEVLVAAGNARSSEQRRAAALACHAPLFDFLQAQPNLVDLAD